MRLKNRVLALRVSDDEMERVHAAAESAGTSVSEWVRRQVFAQVAEDRIELPCVRCDRPIVDREYRTFIACHGTSYIHEACWDGLVWVNGAAS